MDGITEVKEFNTTNTSLRKSDNGEILSYKVGSTYKYPYVLISSSTYKKYKLDVLKGLLRDSGYSAYLETPSGNIKLGYVDTNGLKVLKDDTVFADWNIVVYLSQSEKIEGDMIYALL